MGHAGQRRPRARRRSQGHRAHGKKEGQFIYGVKPCVGNYNATTGKYDLQSYSVAYGCTQPYFLIRQAFQRRTAMFRYDEFRRPIYWEIDMNIAKTIRITDKMRFQIRFEAFNLLNSPMYDERGYSTDTKSSDFGRINRNVTGQSNFQRASSWDSSSYTDRFRLRSAIAEADGTRAVVSVFSRPGFKDPGLFHRYNTRVRHFAPLCALGVLLTVQLSTQTRRITWQDLVPLQGRLESKGLTSATFSAYVDRVANDDMRRVREGDLDHLIFYMLQSTHFSRLAPIEPALSAKALVDGGNKPSTRRAGAGRRSVESARFLVLRSAADLLSRTRRVDLSG